MTDNSELKELVQENERLRAVADAAQRIYGRPMHNQTDEDRLRSALAELEKHNG